MFERGSSGAISFIRPQAFLVSEEKDEKKIENVVKNTFFPDAGHTAGRGDWVSLSEDQNNRDLGDHPLQHWPGTDNAFFVNHYNLKEL